MTTIQSPRFNITVHKNELLANGIYFKNFNDDEIMRNELPFNNIIIKNFSGQKIKVKYGENVQVLAPAEAWIDERAYNTRSIEITNLSSENLDDDIYITVSRLITSQDALLSYLTGVSVVDIANGNGVQLNEIKH